MVRSARFLWRAMLAVSALVVWTAAPAGGGVESVLAPMPNFESGPVNSLLRVGDRLLVLNTPDQRVEVYRIEVAAGPSANTGGATTAIGGGGGGSASGPAGGSGATNPVASRAPGVHLLFEQAVFTGLEPVAMAIHPQAPKRLFVANHVSDTVSVVDLDSLQVVATLPAGDEPQGLGVANGRLFVTAARAPAAPPTPGATDPGVLINHVVTVFDASPPFAFLKTIPIDAWKPRDLTVIDNTVYVIAQNSGNRTRILDENHTKPLGLTQVVADSFDGGPFAVNPILTMPQLDPLLGFARGWYLPLTGRIVHDTEYPAVLSELPDRDIVAIDAVGLAVLPIATRGVGTNLFDIERNPFTGELWVSGTDARNRLRFEPRLRGVAVKNQLAIVPPSRAVRDVIELAPPLTDRELAQPTVIAFLDATGVRRAYVAAQLSSAVAVLDAVSGAPLGAIDTGFLPAGIVTDDEHSLVFVHCRGDQTVRVYEARRDHREATRIRLSYDPQPRSVSLGRRHLYEARPDAGHGNGRMACATCHVFGHADGIAWDLGDPAGSLSNYYPDILTGIGSYPGQLVVAPSTAMVHPLKGPMVTQSLRGLMGREQKDDLTLHWRGERRTIHTFDAAFRSLLGGTGIARREVQEFASFVRSLRYAPNPYQPKDRVYVGEAAAGAAVYGMTPTFQGKAYNHPGGEACIDCHNGDFFGADDFTGSRPVASAGSFNQVFQTAQLRMLYEKDFRDLAGFGALHDGAVDGVRGFMDFHVPNGGPATFSQLTDADKDAISAFTHAWDHGIAPLVGAQFTWQPAQLTAGDAFLDLAEAQARPPQANVDLILKGFRLAPDGTLLRRGAWYRQDPGSGNWGYLFDTGDFVDRAVVKAVVGLGVAVFTFTAVPPGTGERLGIDRDEDGLYDFQETLRGTDPAQPDSDGDGYLDGTEVALGADPLLADATLPDALAPQILAPQALEVGPDLATIACYTNEPCSVQVEVGIAPSSTDIGVFAVAGLRRTHDVILDGLPGGKALLFRITATDRNGNFATFAGGFTTLPPLFHVDDITLSATSSAPFVLTATVRVVDAAGDPVPSIGVTGFFSGDLGGKPFAASGATDAAGVATLTLAGVTPGGPTTIGFSPIYLGSVNPANPYFVGLGGDTPTFFYDVTENRLGYRTVDLP